MALVSVHAGGYRRRKLDKPHAGIVRALKDAGRKVIDLSGVGGSCPDLLVSWAGGPNLLIEIKSDDGDLSDGQRKFFDTWPGPKCVVRTEREALAATGVRV